MIELQVKAGYKLQPLPGRVELLIVCLYNYQNNTISPPAQKLKKVNFEIYIADREVPVYRQSFSVSLC